MCGKLLILGQLSLHRVEVGLADQRGHVPDAHPLTSRADIVPPGMAHRRQGGLAPPTGRTATPIGIKRAGAEVIELLVHGLGLSLVRRRDAHIKSYTYQIPPYHGRLRSIPAPRGIHRRQPLAPHCPPRPDH